MIKLIGISGSLRAGSFNTALLRAAAQVAGADVQLEVATLQGIPLYDGDLESASGIPAAVSALKERVVSSDGVLLATPEYNSGIPGVLKNAFDWMSRPYTDIARVFGGKPVALLGASPSGFGTLLAQSAWLPVLRHVGVNIWNGNRVMVSHAHTLLDAKGEISDEATRKHLGEFVRGFAAYSQAFKR
jgi:chromate reductase, NAD(P)H dehydrogenase (quinone)